MWKLRNALPNHWVKEETKWGMKNYLETNTTYQILWDAAKAVLKGKFIAVSAYIKKLEISHINNLTLQLKELRKE